MKKHKAQSSAAILLSEREALFWGELALYCSYIILVSLGLGWKQLSQRLPFKARSPALP